MGASLATVVSGGLKEDIVAHWTYGPLDKQLVQLWERFAWKDLERTSERSTLKQLGPPEKGDMSRREEAPETALEAEVQCAYCKQRRWVGWDIRHDGKDPSSTHHKLARCPNCPVGQDRTVYTGRCRGQVESKRPD